MGGMREKLTGERTARDPRSKINQALAAWDCDEPELLKPQHVSKGIRPMKITRKMVGVEAPKASKRKNPAKPTVSRKISQLVREGYPQRQAVAIALSEQRAGKVQKVPRKSTPGEPRTVYQVQHSRDGKGYMVWGTYLYAEMAKHVARMRAIEAPYEFVRVVSLKVEA